MSQEISTLMDGELDSDEAARAIRALCASDDRRERWTTYHLIGDAMRGDAGGRAARAQRIFDALEREPTVLAPRRPLSTRTGRIAFAAAASVATVAVVGWIGVQQGRSTGADTLARGAAPASSQPAIALPEPKLVNDYLVVHRQVPNAEFYRPASNRVPAAAR